METVMEIIKNGETDNKKISCVTSGMKGEDNISLATALMRIKLKHGWSELIRASIDQGSTGSFCSERLVKELGLEGNKNNCNVKGIGEPRWCG